ncbi:hypothetical protein BKA66DRAFT_54486 [Pyrenochaeta sp. MPI-SDFR-AT-0127]|nr:hypothetical protein BKA66DRAFT_54486 [Pyrenochaeta sp. MPI-SDFR-AT-0127]
MASKEKESAVLADTTGFTGERPDNSDQASSSGSDKDQIIYTPPESVSNESVPTHNLATANISFREYIYFLPYPLPPGTPVPYSTGLPENNPLNLPTHQFEPTNTLVLTSPNRTFVDIRFFKPVHAGAATILPNKGERERLEWAFAGSSESHPVTSNHEKKEGEKWEGVTHSTWTHWLDSRHSVSTPDIPVDEGDMYPIASNLTLEHGHAFHPHLNAHKTHEEMWRDGDIRSTTPAGTKICIVLRLHADTAGVRGVIIRLGQYCQGIIMKDKHSTVERWEFDVQGNEDTKESSKWKRTARIGDLLLPCSVTFRPEILAVGGSVRYHDYEWAVEEVWEWR